MTRFSKIDVGDLVRFPSKEDFGAWINSWAGEYAHPDCECSKSNILEVDCTDWFCDSLVSSGRFDRDIGKRAGLVLETDVWLEYGCTHYPDEEQWVADDREEDGGYWETPDPVEDTCQWYCWKILFGDTVALIPHYAEAVVEKL